MVVFPGWPCLRFERFPVTEGQEKRRLYQRETSPLFLLADCRRLIYWLTELDGCHKYLRVSVVNRLRRQRELQS